MRDLVRLTGVSAPTIHFWAQQGLLPSAHKTADNQARYPESTLSRIRWIREVQSELRLPLRGISEILEHWGELPVPELVAMQSLGRLLDQPDAPADPAEVDAVTARLEDGDLTALRELGMVATTPMALSGSDLRLLELVAAMRAAGLTEAAGFHIENLAVYRDAVARLMKDELEHIVEPVLRQHDAAQLRDLVRSALPLTNQLLSLLHLRAVVDEAQRWTDIATEEEGIATA